ncbi:MAG: uracil-DNA glycosylase [Geminicoccaceae bacterium]
MTDTLSVPGVPGTARPEPLPSCQYCPRLAAFRSDNVQAFPDWHNAPVPSFGPDDSRLLIVGLAPGLRGANRTGRPFTGDFAGDLLYPTLIRHGFARGQFGAEPDDGLELAGCRITNAVRCVPPANKPVGAEINSCRPFLAGELGQSPSPKVIMTLGGIAHGSTLRALGLPAKTYPFVHGAVYRLPDGRALCPSYHCSRYNVNTRRLTPEMFDAVVTEIRRRFF